MSSDLAARLMAAKHAVMVGDLSLLGQAGKKDGAVNWTPSKRV